MSRSRANDIVLVDVTPAVSASSAYVDNDNIGGKLTLANAVRTDGGGGIVESLVLVDKDKQAPACEVILFAADPDGTTFTDNGAEAIVDADALKILGVVDIASGDWKTFANHSVATKSALGLGFVAAADATAIYAAIVSNAATPTFTSTSALQLRVGIVND